MSEPLTIKLKYEPKWWFNFVMQSVIKISLFVGKAPGQKILKWLIYKGINVRVI